MGKPKPKSKSKSKFSNERKSLKRTVKFLAHAPNPRIAKAILRQAHPGVVRAIANAALNAQRNPAVKLSPADRTLFAAYPRTFDILTDKHRKLEDKRKHLLQKGGAFPIVIPLLASVLGSLGSAVISKVFNKQPESAEDG